jgi:hypothetical protein
MPGNELPNANKSAILALKADQRAILISKLVDVGLIPCATRTSDGEQRPTIRPRFARPPRPAGYDPRDIVVASRNFR